MVKTALLVVSFALVGLVGCGGTGEAEASAATPPAASAPTPAPTAAPTPGTTVEMAPAVAAPAAAPAGGAVTPLCARAIVCCNEAAEAALEFSREGLRAECADFAQRVAAGRQTDAQCEAQMEGSRLNMGDIGAAVPASCH